MMSLTVFSFERVLFWNFSHALDHCAQDNLLENLGRPLDHYSENYENFMFMWGF